MTFHTIPLKDRSFTFSDYRVFFSSLYLCWWNSNTTLRDFILGKPLPRLYNLSQYNLPLMRPTLPLTRWWLNGYRAGLAFGALSLIWVWIHPTTFTLSKGKRWQLSEMKMDPFCLSLPLLYSSGAMYVCVLFCVKEAALGQKDKDTSLQITHTP